MYNFMFGVVMAELVLMAIILIVVIAILTKRR